MAKRYNFKYLPLVGKLPGKSMVEQTETAINELASVVYDNLGGARNLAEEVQTANTNASNALDKATEALETSSRVYIKQIAAVDVNDYYDSELYYINNDGSTNIPVRDSGFLEVKTNDDKTACEQVFIADSTGTPYYRHGMITEQTLGEETTYVVTWSGWSSKPASQAYVDDTLSGFADDLKEKATWCTSVSAMKSDTGLAAGMVVATKGYYITNDGGAAVYTIRAKTEDDVDDGGSIIVLDNDNVAELITDGAINVKQFGAKGNGEADDTTTLKATVQYAYANSLKVYLPKGTYCISEPLHLYQYQTLYGNSVDNTIIKSTAPDTENNAIIILDRTDDYKFNYGQYYHINNITLTSVNNIPYGIYASGAAPYLDFSDLYIMYVKTGISVKDTWLSSIKDTRITQIDVGIQLRVQGTSLHLENIYIIHPTKYGYEMHGLSYSEWSNVACDWATASATAYFFAYGNVTINGLGCESEKCKTCIEQQNSTLSITGAVLYFPETDTGDSVFYVNGASTLTITNAYIALAGSLSANNTAVGFKLATNNIINITRMKSDNALTERMKINGANSSYIHINDYTSSHSFVGITPYLGDIHTNFTFYKDMIPYNDKMNCIYGNIYGNVDGRRLAKMDGADISWGHAAKSGDILINCKPNTGIAFQQCMNDPTLYTLKGTVTAIDGNTITLSDWGFADDTMATFARNMGTTINASGIFNGVAVESISETDKTIVLKDASSASSFQIGAKVTYKNNIKFLRDEEYKVVQHVLAGKTEDKPTTPVTGMMYFDTTLNKPVWYNGSNWVDANGNNV